MSWSIILLLLVLLQSHVQATPVPPLADAVDLVCIHRRDMLNIVWGCFATIFACTWVAVHPNIPAPDDSFTIIAARRLQSMIWAVLAPEVVILWAMRQWYYARKFGRFYQSHGWTTTHGFFVQMGGFMLYDENGPRGVLSFQSLHDLVNAKIIDSPRITEEDIQDRSKGDFLSKGLVVLQTTWFILQCIARLVQHLPLTELELITLAFAVLNGAMYYLWWNKPLDVRRPFPIYIKAIESSQKSYLRTSMEIFLGRRPPRAAETLQGKSDDIGYVQAEEREESERRNDYDQEGESGKQEGKPEDHSQEEKSLGNTNFNPLIFAKHVLYRIHEFTKKSRANLYLERPKDYWFLFVGILLSPLRSLEAMADSDFYFNKGAMRVPTYYANIIAGVPGESYQVGEHARHLIFCGPAFITLVFSAIHCIGWTLQFPTYHEWVLWQFFSFIMVGVSCIFIAYAIHAYLGSAHEDYPRGGYKGSELVGRILHQLCVIATILYIPARIYLLIEALYSLRDLPDAAYQTVRWTTFIPNLRFQ